MKKILLGAILLLGVSSMTSCKKDWQCECTVGTFDLENQTKSEATENCDDLSSGYALIGGSCSLK